MNKLYCLLILFIAYGVCDSQNLVPNPSFEDTIQCPIGLGRIQDAVGWYHAGNSPDYFNPCATTAGASNGVPINFTGNQFAYDGNSYAGLVTYYTSFPQGYREYIGVQLTQALSIGTKYYVSANISRGDSIFGTEIINCSTNKFGFRFSTISFYNAAPTDNFSHIHSDSIITDAINWTEISGSFISDSAYQYLIIGNFYDDAHTDTAQCLGNAYYLVDMVYVSTDSLANVGLNELKNEENKLILFPNPFLDKINITAKTNELLELSLYDVTSRKIFNQSFTNSTSINTEQLAKGLYLYEVRNKSGVIKKGKVVKD